MEPREREWVQKLDGESTEKGDMLKGVTCCFQLTVTGTKKYPKNMATN